MNTINMYVLPYIREQLQLALAGRSARPWWVGFDLDGTLAEELSGTFPNVGKPILPMIDVLRECLMQGIPCKIVTARVSDIHHNESQSQIIKEWLEPLLRNEQFGLPVPEVTASKDLNMVLLFDNRVVPVVTNLGRCLLPAWSAEEPENHPVPVAGSPRTVPDILRVGASTYEERNKTYGDNYKHFGTVMTGLFPEGITLRTPEDFVKFGLLVNCTTKIGRYAGAFREGGHLDSAHDLCVFGALLEEVTQ